MPNKNDIRKIWIVIRIVLTHTLSHANSIEVVKPNEVNR
jgi:hypothetical protein